MTSTRHPQVNIPNTEVRSIISEFVGDTFKLFVALLNHDAQSKKRYPVLIYPQREFALWTCDRNCSDAPIRLKACSP